MCSDNLSEIRTATKQENELEQYINKNIDSNKYTLVYKKSNCPFFNRKV